jgi:hypothetical protein
VESPLGELYPFAITPRNGGCSTKKLGGGRSLSSEKGEKKRKK